MLTRALAALTLSLTLTAGVTAKPPENRFFEVSMKVYDAGKLTMSPRLVTRADEPAEVMTRDEKQQLQIIARFAKDDRFVVASNLVHWTPQFLMGDEASIEVPITGKTEQFTLEKFNPATGEKTPLRVEVKIKPIKVLRYSAR
jgi:hypothetical protein